MPQDTADCSILLGGRPATLLRQPHRNTGSGEEVIGVVAQPNSRSDVKLDVVGDQEGKTTFWHSSAHLLAEALEALYPGTKFGIGPAIDNGFYYDIDTGDRQIGTDQIYYLYPNCPAHVPS